MEINWKPFFIDPSTKAGGEDYMAYCKRRWGGDGWTGSLPGKREGRKFSNWRIWPNVLHLFCVWVFVCLGVRASVRCVCVHACMCVYVCARV